MTTLRSVSGLGTLRSGQTAASPRTVDANAFGELSDAPSPAPGEVIGWDVNGALANISPAMFSAKYTTGTLPAPGASLLGISVALQDPGDPYYVLICVGNSSGGYEWVGIAQSS
jgi:hypothetical protein